jgi:hypothetical protein
MDSIITVAGIACLFLAAGVCIGLLWAASRPAAVERARALLRTGGVGEEK